MNPKKKEIEDKLAKIREAKSKNAFGGQKSLGPSDIKATRANTKAGRAAGTRKVGSGD